MTAPGQPTQFWVLENPDGFYYVSFSKPWTSQLHYAAMLSEDLAARRQKRYPGSTIESQMAYSVEPLETLASVNEPEWIAALAFAAKPAAQEGVSLPTLLFQAEKFHTSKT